MRVLICGGRDHFDGQEIRRTLAGYKMKYGDRLEVIHGDARGADRAADVIARDLGIRVRKFPADWRGHGKAAGPIRNKLMLSERPDVVHAFKDGFDYKLDHGGTENMVGIALAANVPVRVHSHGASDRVASDGGGCLRVKAS